ncbi:MAG: translocation/assembly module TamB domain-containing protein [Gammaproteobacteria bacterium]|nr:translocation/assembly module TamB domain-containing protein [Gammaproteobacteria bacterium]
MKRRLRRLALTCSVVLLLGWYFFFETTAGLNFLLNKVVAQYALQFSVAQVTGQASGPFTLQGLHYQDKHLQLTIDTLEVDWRLLKLIGQSLDLKTLTARGVELRLLPTSGMTADTNVILPISINVDQALVQTIRIYAANSLQPVSIDTLRLRAQVKGQTLSFEQLDLAAYQGELHSQGKVTLDSTLSMQFTQQWQYRPERLPVVMGQGVIRGTQQQLEIEQHIDTGVHATLRGRVYQLFKDVKWQADINLQQLEWKTWLQHSPALHTAGTIAAKGDLQRLRVDAQLLTQHPTLGRLATQLSVTSEDWFKHYQPTLDGQWLDDQRLKATLSVTGEGDRDTLRLQQVYVKTSEGDVRANAQFSWRPHLQASAQVALHNFDTSLFSPAWPGHVGAQFTVNTTLQHNTPNINLELHALTGELRGYPLQGRAKAQWRTPHLKITQLDLAVGKSEFSLQGNYGPQWDLHARLRSPNLNTLYPDASGALQARLDIQGEHSRPWVRVHWQATTLEYQDYFVDAFSGDVEVDLARNATLQIVLQAKNLSYLDWFWKTASMQTTGDNARHEISVRFDDQAEHVYAHAVGSYRALRWQAELDQLDIAQQAIGEWQLQSPVQLTAAPHHYAIDKLCLQQAAANLCTDLDWTDSDGHATLTTQEVPAAIMNPWLPFATKLQGKVNITAGVTSSQELGLTAHLDLLLSQARVLLATAQPTTLSFAPIHAQADLNPAGLEARLDLPLQSGGSVVAALNLPQWRYTSTLDPAQAMQAKLRLTDLAAQTVAQFFSDLGQVEGKLNADITATGSIGEPQVTGEASWRGGNITFASQGVGLHDINVTLSSAASNTLKLSARARGDDGDLQIEGSTQLQSANHWPTTLHLTGNSLQVMNTSEVRLFVSPDLTIQLQGSSITIRGQVQIPRARLRPRNLSDGSVALSRDVVIVSNTQPQTVDERWKVSTKIRVLLGEGVDFDGFGVNGKLSGNLQIIDEPNQLSVGQGELGIKDGIYRMRGQNLTISRGRLIFANSLLDDPGVDLEASRVIGTITAGVRVRGTLKKPELSIFSDPAMAESDALSYVLLGHPLNQATGGESEAVRNATTALGVMGGDLLARDIGGKLGLDELRVEAGQTTEQTALVFGKYLSSRLYVRYITGIVESSNLVQLRYQLTKNIQIQTEGGYRGTQSITGGDIVFTIEY